MKTILFFLTLVSLSSAQSIYVWNIADGTVAVTRLILSEKPTDLTTDTFILNQVARSRPVLAVGTYVQMDEADLPDEYFRDAWNVQNGKVVIDRGRAEILHRNRMKNESRQKASKGVITYTQSDAECVSIDALNLSTIVAPSMDDLKNRKP